MGDAYEYLISNFASDAGKKGGEFFTPPEVSTLIAKIVSDRTGVKIYDPTCGSGSLLIKVNKEIGRENCTIYGRKITERIKIYFLLMRAKNTIKANDKIN